MNKYCLYTVFFCLSTLFSCNEDEKIRLVKEWSGKRINFPVKPEIRF